MQSDQLAAIFERITQGQHTEADLQTLQKALSSSDSKDSLQIGKYNVQIGQGQDIQIGDRIYQGADAAAIEAILQDTLHNVSTNALQGLQKKIKSRRFQIQAGAASLMVLLTGIGLNALAKGNATTLIDFRESTYAEEISPAQSQSILSEVFPNGYLSSSDGCIFDAETSGLGLSQAEAQGQFVPRVWSFASGSFTQPGVPQEAYVINLEECSAGHSDNYGTTRLYIVAGRRVVMDVEVPATSIDAIVDINGDGIDELLLTKGSTGQGYTVVSADLISLQNSEYKHLQVFPEVYNGACGTLDENATETMAEIVYYPKSFNSEPIFEVTHYEAPCVVDENSQPQFHKVGQESLRLENDF